MTRAGRLYDEDGIDGPFEANMRAAMREDARILAGEVAPPVYHLRGYNADARSEAELRLETDTAATIGEARRKAFAMAYGYGRRADVYAGEGRSNLVAWVERGQWIEAHRGVGR